MINPFAAKGFEPTPTASRRRTLHISRLIYASYLKYWEGGRSVIALGPMRASGEQGPLLAGLYKWVAFQVLSGALLN